VVIKRKGGVKMLIRMKKAQNTAEYAILWAIVVAAALAMQHEVRRSIQGTMHTALEQHLFTKTGLSINYYEPQSGNKTRNTSTSEQWTKEIPSVGGSKDEEYRWNYSSTEEGNYNAKISQ
jgi:hypothetical protein